MNFLVRNKDFALNPFEELSRLFNLGWENSGLYDQAMSPAVDLVEHDDAYVLTADLPGVQKKDLEVSVENNVLTLKGEKNIERDSKKEVKFFRRETWAGTFHRTVSLPAAADPANVEAKLEDGLLRITIGKREELKPRQITIGG